MRWHPVPSNPSRTEPVLYRNLGVGCVQRRVCIPDHSHWWVISSSSPNPDIYRIVSSKSLESSGDVIKPSGGETILVTPTADDGGASKSGKCC